LIAAVLIEQLDLNLGSKH